MTPEAQRLTAAQQGQKNWKKWDPYLSERQWGTVREDDSNDGNAWDFSHDQGRSRAYRWGEDGLGGITDDGNLLCFALALWNGNDPILKERLFGLTNSEGNHGEDVKEYYFYLDSTPTHSYMKYLYKYPQAAFPYEDLVRTNRSRSRHELEYELLDTGIFDDDRYFDVFVEYAKADAEDILIQISICNRGDTAAIHALPTLWFRNTWSWAEGDSKPMVQKVEGMDVSVVRAYHTDDLFQEKLGEYYLYCDRELNNGKGDIEFLKYAFSKLLINFTWWVNRKDASGNNIFEGGFLGLDNIGVFDRSSPLPTGGRLEQADGTAWMVFFSQRMLQIAIELALHDPLYEELALKFFEHTMWIAGAMDRIGDNQDELWDESDGFFYDVLRLPDGRATRLKARSMVGLLPLMAVSVFPKDVSSHLPRFNERVRLFMQHHPEIVNSLHPLYQTGHEGRLMLSILNEQKLRRILSRVLDESEFLSDYGIRSLSRYYQDHPYCFYHAGQEYRVDYLPGDSNTGMFGGNSNWRGPIWMPVNFLLLRALVHLYSYYGDSFAIEYPTGSGQQKTLYDVGKAIGERLVRIFARDESGRRPVYGGAEKFQTDPHWRDLILFYEYFHGDNGAGIGASHQTGWTGCVARIIQAAGFMTKEVLLSTATPGMPRYK